MPSKNEIQAMARLFHGGRLEDCLALGSELLAKYPKSPQISNMMGVVNARLGRLDEALQHYERALSCKPDYAEVHNNRGNLLNRLGRSAEAITSFQRAIATYPNYAEAHNNLGSLYQERGEFDAAAECFNAAIRIKPAFAEAYNGLGNVQRDLDRPEDAAASFARALTINPNYVLAYKNMGDTLRSLGKLDQAMRSYERAIELEPGFPAPYLGLALILIDLGKHREAVSCLEKAVQLNPEFADAYGSLGNAQSELGLHEEAMASYRAALRINPNLADVHCRLGSALSEIGRYDDAIASYQDALQAEPQLAEAHINLSRLKTYQCDDPQIAQMLGRMANPEATDNERMHLSFALGKVYEDLGDTDQAFKHILNGNRLRRAEFAYDIAKDRGQFETIKSLFNAANASHVNSEWPPGSGETQPIFIVGTLRSGTTLTEQILASHSKVWGAGELENLGRLLEPAVEKAGLAGTTQLDTVDLLSCRDNYLRDAGARAADAPFVTDKMPSNFKWIGFLLTTMPGVKIVHVSRDPVASCWSMFKLQFRAHGYTNDLEDLGRYYRLYLDLMDFWRQEFPGQIYDLKYEALTENQQEETRRLLAHCELDWEDQCLEFYKTRRAVRTLSDNQVRQEMYTGSSKAWQKYRSHLAPLISALEGGGPTSQ